MKRKMMLVMGAALAFLAGCGADGEPETPGAAHASARTGVSVSGSATFGVVRGPANMPQRP